METLNPLSNGRVIGANANAADYIKNEFPRGHRSFVMSRSALCEFNVCPSRWLAGIKDDDTTSTEWGSLMDCRVLEPEKFTERYAVTPEMYPCEPTKKDPRTEKPWSRNATFCKEWEESVAPRIAITKKEEFESAFAVKRLMVRQSIREMIEQSDKQVLVEAEYRDRETEIVVPIKCLIDLVPHVGSAYGKSLADFKTSRSASPREWVRFVFQHNYHVQAAMYLDAYVAATGEDRLEFRHVIQENFSPYQPARRIVSEEYLELGRITYKNALKRYCRCLASDEWPDYDEEARESINGWQFAQPEPWMVGQ
jgi:hypothetical protein